jgi:hypothetical protein
MVQNVTESSDSVRFGVDDIVRRGLIKLDRTDRYHFRKMPIGQESTDCAPP